MSRLKTSRLSDYLVVVFYLNTVKWINADDNIYLVRPGDGNDFVYSPVHVNATLHCTLNSVFLAWIVDGLSFTSQNTEGLGVLKSRGIFETTSTSTEGVTQSTLTVYGDITTNGNSSICCTSTGDPSCTTLIVYDRPSPPINLTVHVTNMTESVNISWRPSTSIAAVKQSYKVIFDSETIIETSQLHYIYEQSMLGIKCVAYVQAVNGAGESDPSNNVTIPSLPDIEPVTASLTHQVWKSNGHIMVNVSFEEAENCENYLVLAYNITLRPQTMAKHVEVSISGNRTEVVLGPDDGINHDQKYSLSVTAINMIGNVTFDTSKVVVTSDLQGVNVSLVNEFTLNVQCMFIMGSDSLGCSVLVISNRSGVESANATLSRKQEAMYASGHLNLIKKSHCYDRLLAFNIDKQTTTSNLSVETELPWRTNILTCSAKTAQFPVVTVVASTIPVAIIVITITVIATAAFVVTKLKAGSTGKQVLASSGIVCEAPQESESKIQCSTLQNDDIPPPSLLDTHLKAEDTPQSPILTLPLNKETASVSELTEDKANTPPPTNTPLYAVPFKLKKKNMCSDQQSTHKRQKTNIPSSEDDESNNKAQGSHVLESTTDKLSHGNSNEQDESEQDHIYHVLEQREVPDAVPLSPSHDAPQLPPPFDPDNFTPTPVYQDITELQTK